LTFSAFTMFSSDQSKFFSGLIYPDAFLLDVGHDEFFIFYFQIYFIVLQGLPYGAHISIIHPILLGFRIALQTDLNSPCSPTSPGSF
jgi:hypothetical protein